tara:strand:- start:336 stop:539 length:204 start_codon:yes stop_codon:yes gene_type:complete
MDLSRVFEAIISYNDPSTKGINMTEEDQTPKRLNSLEDADNEQSNLQLMWSIGILVLGFLIILVIYR